MPGIFMMIEGYTKQKVFAKQKHDPDLVLKCNQAIRSLKDYADSQVPYFLDTETDDAEPRKLPNFS